MENTPSVAMSRSAPALRGLEDLLEGGHVAVGVAVPLGLAEPDAVDDRGVVERVGDDRVLLAEQGLEEPAVGVEGRAVEDRVLGADEGRDAPLELPCGCPACRR
jgi:hypothetical protein